MPKVIFEEDGRPYLDGRVLLAGDKVEVFVSEVEDWSAGEIFFGPCFNGDRNEYGVRIHYLSDWAFLPLEAVKLRWPTAPAF
jgi:hypothetical protein